MCLCEAYLQHLWKLLTSLLLSCSLSSKNLSTLPRNLWSWVILPCKWYVQVHKFWPSFSEMRLTQNRSQLKLIKDHKIMYCWAWYLVLEGCKITFVWLMVKSHSFCVILLKVRLSHQFDGLVHGKLLQACIGQGQGGFRLVILPTPIRSGHQLNANCLAFYNWRSA